MTFSKNVEFAAGLKCLRMVNKVQDTAGTARKRLKVRDLFTPSPRGDKQGTTRDKIRRGDR